VVKDGGMVTSAYPAFVPQGGTSSRWTKHACGEMKSFREGRYFGAQAQARFSKEFEEEDVTDCFLGKDC